MSGLVDRVGGVDRERRGTQERGGALSDEARAWAAGLTGKLLASKREGEVRLGTELVVQLRLAGEEKTLIRLAAPGSSGV